MTEQWKDIPGYGGLYEASDMGRIRVKERCVMKYNWRANAVIGQTYKARILVGATDKGYRVVHLGVGGTKFRVAVHRLVLLAFVGYAPEGCEACHGNGDRTDNRLSNLRWDTHYANNQDRRAHGRYASGRDHPMAKFTAEQIAIAQAAASLKEAVALTGMSRHQAWRHRRGR
jgi:hypothetical protein